MKVFSIVSREPMIGSLLFDKFMNYLGENNNY